MDVRQSHDEAIDENLRRKFEAAWIQGQPLAIEDCLPPREAAAWLPTLEELIHIELEFAWKAWADGRSGQTNFGSGMQPALPLLIEQYLARFPPLHQPEIVARLIEQEFLVREQAGDGPAWDEYRRRFGELSGLGLAGDTQIHQAATQVIGRQSARPALLAASTPHRSDVPRRFGNYELLEEVGRGGMGVVYRARQLTADRIVALKMVRADQLSGLRPELRTSALERFRHEALAAARLEHEHIVTVYEVGEAEGERYFSMRYVEGQSLADLVCGGPLDGRRAAAYLEPVARAVAVAHEAGILHRDLKPQNILIDARTDRAMIADFGLAKLLEQSPELTRAGDIMGTPAYMSPEQARDSAKVTVRSDIYSLGATLYHTIAARPPFQAATSLESLRQLREEEPARPSLVNPAIDRDLETICLACLHKEPANRYATAAALADDLRRYLDGMPILARPVGPGERVARWCRRNPLLAAAIGLAGAFFVTALVATSVGYATTAAALRGKTRALEESERSYRQAREVVNQFFKVVSEDILLDQPGAEPLRNRLLQLALDHDRQFLADRGHDPALLEEVARSHFRVGLITQAIHPDGTAGLESLGQALAIQRRLEVASPGNPALQEAQGDTLNALGQAYLRGGDGPQAMQHFARALDVRQRLAADHQQLSPGRKYANTQMNIGLVHKHNRSYEEATAAFDQAQKLREQLLVGRDILIAKDEELLVWRDLSMGCFNLANIAIAAKRPESAEDAARRAVTLMEQIVGIDASDLRNRQRLAACYHLLGRLRYNQRDYAQARGHYARAIDALENLHAGSQQVHEFREQLALVYLDLGRLCDRERNATAAVAAVQLACDHLAPITPPAEATEHPTRRRNYAVALRELARQQLQLNRRVEARENLERSRTYLERRLEQTDDPLVQQELQQDQAATEKLLLPLLESLRSATPPCSVEFAM